MAIEILSYSLLKDVALLIWRKLGRRPTETETTESAPLARILSFGDVRSVDVPLGWRAAILDDERVQTILKPGRHRGWQLKRLRRRFGLSPAASLVMWCSQPVRVQARPSGIFAKDSHEFEAEVTVLVAARPDLAAAQSLAGLPRDTNAVVGAISDDARRIVLGEISRLEGRAVDSDVGLPERLRQQLESVIRLRLVALGVALIGIDRVVLRSPFLVWVRKQESRGQADRERLRIAEEGARVRGALRKEMLARELAEIKDRDDFEAMAAAVRQDARLRELVLRGELQQAELDAKLKEIEIWKRKQAAFEDTYGWVLEHRAHVLESAAAFADALRQRVMGEQSAFTPHERTQIAACLAESVGRSVSAGDVLAAVQGGVEIPTGVFDPFHRLHGTHTMGVGWQRRVFDGETLWTIRLCGIGTRRHGFLWRDESPALARFEIQGKPGNLLLKKDVNLTATDSIQLGQNGVRCELVSGRPLEITLKLSRLSAGMTG